MKHPNRRRAAVAIAALGLLAAACGDDGGDSSPTTTNAPTATTGGGSTATTGAPVKINDSAANGITATEIKIGWMGDLTGPTASSQKFNHDGVKTYFDCLNDKGGIAGKKIKFIGLDDKFQVDPAKANYTQLVNDEKILAFAGMGGSQIITPLQPQIETDGVAVVGPPQTIDVTLKGKQVFSNLAHYGDQADLAWEQIKKDVGGAANAKVVGIALEVPSGHEMNTYSRASVEAGGGKWLGSIYIAGTATEANAQMVKLKEFVGQGANYVVMHGSPASSQVVLQGMSDNKVLLPVIGIHGVAVTSVFTKAPADSVAKAFGMHSFIPATNASTGANGAALKACAEKSGFGSAIGEPNFTHGYVNGHIIKQAIEKAAASNGGNVTRATFTAALKGKFDTLGFSCQTDWSTSQHSACGAAFNYDTATKGMKPANPFDFYQKSFDGKYELKVTE